MATLTQRRFKGKALRLTLLDACGNPVHGSASTCVSKGAVQITLHPVYENGTDYLMRNMNDELEINEQGLPLLRWWEAQIELINVDPAIVNMVTGAPLVTDDAANIVGWRSRESVTSNFSLETWTDLAGLACTTGNKSYGYNLLPWVLNPQLGDLKVDNATATLTLTAHTHNASPWGTGPYNVRLNGSSVASPLATAIQSLDHFHTEVVQLAPPAVTTGAVALP